MRWLVLFAALSACAPVMMSPEAAADICEEQARAAQGPTGRVTVGVNSNSGPSTSVEVGLSSDFLAGRDPLEVYRECVRRRSGQEPIRPPVLRNI